MKYSCSDVICFAKGDGESNGDKKSNRNIDALMAKFKSMEKELKILQKQTAQSKAGPVKDNVRIPPSSSGKKFKSTTCSHFDLPRSGKQLVPASDSDNESVATDHKVITQTVYRSMDACWGAIPR
jgi:hypothetical protein